MLKRESLGATAMQCHRALAARGIAAAVQFLEAGERAGKGSEVRLPDPRDSATIKSVEGFPVAPLPRLIEVQIACGEGNLHLTHKDFADVVELIAAHNLDGTFSVQLHESVRKTFRALVKNARGGQ